MFDISRLHLTWTEEKVLRHIARYAPEGGALVMSRLADEASVTRSVAVNALRKAAIAGVIETRSLGMHGTMIIVRNAEVWSLIARGA